MNFSEHRQNSSQVGYLLVHDGAGHLPDLAEAQLRGVQQHRLPAQADLDVEGDHTSSSSSSATAISSAAGAAGAGVVGPPWERERARRTDQRRRTHESPGGF